ncbi:MAG TPA: magnesium chelatase, partial [Flavobacteriales bacterium]|nr:magnesium chelatase [Flavobacteriales bacterium]
DIQFVFTANPEDYTNRGAIITLLKDRIQSQILTHYPSSIELGMKITSQEVRSPKEQTMRVKVPDLIRVLVERIAMEARKSEFVDPKSGVSARLTISALESVISAAELRALRNGEDRTVARITDLFAIIPAVTGKIELVYEGEQEGPEKVAQHLLDVALRNVFKELFPDPDKSRKLGRSATAPNATKRDIYSDIIAWFDENRIDIALTARNQVYQAGLRNVPGLDRLVQERHPYLEADEVPLWMEFVLHGLAEFSRIGRSSMVRSVKFGDVLGSVLGGGVDEEEEDEG